MFISNNFGGRLQRISLNAEDKELLVNVQRELTTYIDNLEHIRSERRMGFTWLQNQAGVINYFN